VLRTTNKQNKQHGAIVCSNYGLLYVQHVSPHKLTNKSEYQTTQNLIQNLNKSNKYRIIEYWITSLVSNTSWGSEFDVSISRVLNISSTSK